MPLIALQSSGFVSSDKDAIRTSSRIKVVGSTLAIFAVKLGIENRKKLFCADLRQDSKSVLGLSIAALVIEISAFKGRG